MFKNILFLLQLITISSLPISLLGDQNGVAPPRDLWCVAKNNADDQSLQAAIDWACGPGGANCNPIQKGASCYDPNDLQTTASWAFNDYFLKNGLTDDACFFSNTAAITSYNPSHGDCKFPSSLSVNNGNISGTTTTTSIGMGPDSADLSGSVQIASTWFRSAAIGILFSICTTMIGA